MGSGRRQAIVLFAVALLLTVGGFPSRAGAAPVSNTSVGASALSLPSHHLFGAANPAGKVLGNGNGNGNGGGSGGNGGGNGGAGNGNGNGTTTSTSTTSTTSTTTTTIPSTTTSTPVGSTTTTTQPTTTTTVQEGGAASSTTTTAPTPRSGSTTTTTTPETTTTTADQGTTPPTTIPAVSGGNPGADAPPGGRPADEATSGGEDRPSSETSTPVEEDGFLSFFSDGDGPGGEDGRDADASPSRSGSIRSVVDSWGWVDAAATGSGEALRFRVFQAVVRAVVTAGSGMAAPASATFTLVGLLMLSRRRSDLLAIPSSPAKSEGLDGVASLHLLR